MDLSCLNGVTSATADPEMNRLDILIYPLLLEIVVFLTGELAFPALLSFSLLLPHLSQCSMYLFKSIDYQEKALKFKIQKQINIFRSLSFSCLRTFFVLARAILLQKP